jgi:hypothetical protein
LTGRVSTYCPSSIAELSRHRSISSGSSGPGRDCLSVFVPRGGVFLSHRAPRVSGTAGRFLYRSPVQRFGVMATRLLRRMSSSRTHSSRLLLGCTAAKRSYSSAGSALSGAAPADDGRRWPFFVVGGALIDENGRCLVAQRCEDGAALQSTGFSNALLRSSTRAPHVLCSAFFSAPFASLNHGIHTSSRSQRGLVRVSWREA